MKTSKLLLQINVNNMNESNLRNGMRIGDNEQWHEMELILVAIKVAL